MFPTHDSLAFYFAVLIITLSWLGSSLEKRKKERKRILHSVGIEYDDDHADKVGFK